MEAAETSRAVAAAVSTASALGLKVDEAIVLHNSNRLALRLLPGDVLARVAGATHGAAPSEVELAQLLAASGSPVAVLDPRLEPRPYQHDGFVITLWTYYESPVDRVVPPADYALALERLHAGLRSLAVTSLRFTDRVAEAYELVASAERTPDLTEADRELLVTTLGSHRLAVENRGAAEQLLHGEPHPGNLLATKQGPLFIDLETVCRGPVEFDLAHVPAAVSRHYRNVDQELLEHCRVLVLAMVAAWRADRADRFPDGRRAGRALIRALVQGPPWPTLDEVMGQ